MKIAIFGAGQLAMMMIQAVHQKKHEFIVVDPSTRPPASHYTEHMQADYDDSTIIKEIGENFDIATIDFENVSVKAMRELEKYIPVHPSSHALDICQDRLKEKNLFRKLNINTTEYYEINDLDDLKKNLNKNKHYILKSRRFGYDGKNQYRIKPDIEIKTDLIKQDCILEELVDFEAEVSLICVKATNGDVYYYPLVENHHKNGILSMSRYPSNYTFLQNKAQDIAEKLLEAMNYIGVLVIEFFVNSNKELVANEMAPRVHNSGHWTIEGSSLSQFSAHIDAISGSHDYKKSITFKPSVMFNILSKHITNEKAEALKSKFDISLHDYHKAERMNRKLGHLTFTCENKKELDINIKEIAEVIQ